MTHYETLGVEKDASAEQIKKAYRKLARSLHPDKNPGNEQAEAKFKAITEAYSVLSDAKARSEYDESLKPRPKPAASGGWTGGRGGTAAGFGGFDTSGFDFEDLFSSSGFTSRRGPRKGQDVQAEITIDFKDMIHGLTSKLTLSEAGICPSCQGTGCAACQGLGQVTASRTVTVRIPAGVTDGRTLRIEGKGAEGAGGGPRGDLLLKVRVRPDETFYLEDGNLTVDVRVTMSEAALGAQVKVPTPRGKTVTVKIPAGSQDGKVMKIPQAGIDKNGHKQALRMKVKVVVPTHLNEKAAELLREFDKEARLPSPRKWEQA